MVNRVINTLYHNRFDIEVRDAKTGKLKQQAKAYNIILDQGWDRIMFNLYSASSTTYDWFGVIAFGDGTGELSPTRTALFNQLGTKTAGSGVYDYDYDEGWCSFRQSIQILESEHVGKYLSEVGIGTESWSYKLITHALLQDMNGNPVIIEKTDVDIITIYATVYLIIPPNTGPAMPVAFEYKPVNKNTILAGLLGRYVVGNSDNIRQLFPAWFSVYEGIADSPFPLSLSYDVNALYSVALSYGNGILWTKDLANKRFVMYRRLAAASGNGGNQIGVRSIRNYYSGYGGIIVRIDPSTHTQGDIEEQIGIGDGETTDFATKFPFVQSGSVINVNGSPVSATVYTGIPNGKNIRFHMRNLGIDGNGALTSGNAFSVFHTNNSCNITNIFENPFYATYGIDSITGENLTVYASDDLSTWVSIGTGSSINVSAGDKNKRYWKFEYVSSDYYVAAINCDALENFKNVQIDTAPAEGAVITAVYNTDVAAKDSDHVLDVTVTLQLGEYTPT